MRLLTLARDLRRRKARERERSFVAEGVRAVEDVLRAGMRLRGALMTDAAIATERGAALLEALRAAGVDVLRVPDDDFASAADTEQPQGVLAIARIPDADLATFDPPTPARVLVLDAVQDPGNVGTMLRTAAALGVQGVIALPGTVDPWNAKVVRSAVGAHGRLPIFDATEVGLAEFLAARAIVLWGTDAGGAPLDAAPAPSRLALAMGNEGAGLTPAVQARCARVVALPMHPGTESLNVAVAAGIALYALRPTS